MKAPLILAIIVILHFNCFSQGSESKTHYIGEKFGGGVIFYIDGSGQHGLIAAPLDQAYKQSWCRDRNNYTTIGAYNISDGLQNTKDIISVSKTNSAAGLCDTLKLNGFTGWYLPSLKELSMMYNQLMVVGGFAMASYWSSTEDLKNNGYAWIVNFSNKGKEQKTNKSKKNCVRAVRRF